MEISGFEFCSGILSVADDLINIQICVLLIYQFFAEKNIILSINYRLISSKFRISIYSKSLNARKYIFP